MSEFIILINYPIKARRDVKKNQIILLTSMTKKISSCQKFDSVGFIITGLRSNGKKRSVLFGSMLSCCLVFVGSLVGRR